MTREEATSKLKWYLEGNFIEDISGCEGLEEAIDMAIEALSNTFNTLDTIYRQDAIDAVMEFMPSLTTPDGSGTFDREIFEAQEMFFDIGQALSKLPSAQPEQNTGKWIEHKNYPGLAYLCSECNHFTTVRYLFCPNCGAKMRGEDDD